MAITTSFPLALPLATSYFLINKLVSVFLEDIGFIVRPGRIICSDSLTLCSFASPVKNACKLRAGVLTLLKQWLFDYFCSSFCVWIFLSSSSLFLNSFSPFLNLIFLPSCFLVNQLSGKDQRFALGSALAVIDHTLLPYFPESLRLSPVARESLEETSGLHSL